MGDKATSREEIRVLLTLSESRRFRPFLDWGEEDCSVTPLGGSCYRLNDLLTFLPFQVEDEREANRIKPDRNGLPVLRVERRISRSGHRKISFHGGHAGFHRGAKWDRALGQVVDRGGRWCVIFGGCLFVSLPPGTSETDFPFPIN